MRSDRYCSAMFVRTCCVQIEVHTGFKQQIAKVNGHTEMSDKAIAVTCAKGGKTAGKYCTASGVSLIAQETFLATGHNFGKWVETIPARSTSGR